LEIRNRRVVITGGAGFIGSHLADQLLKLGSKVIVIDNLDPYYHGKEKNILHNLKNENFRFLKLDILDLEKISRVFKNADIIFHLAAQPGVRYSIENPHKTNLVNVEGTLNVLLAAKKNNVKKVIVASSSVYGIPTYTPIDENHPLNPISVYGASKVAAEKYCKVLSNLTNLYVVILRYHSVYGPRQRPDMAVHKWVKAALKGQSLVIYGDGNQLRDFTYVSDVVDATIAAAEVEDIKGEIFNIGSGKAIKIKNVVEIILKHLHKSYMKPVYERPQPGDMPCTWADITKAKKILNYKPKVTLETGLNILLPSTIAGFFIL
jgi:UDP-glucose 4-epimerase